MKRAYPLVSAWPRRVARLAVVCAAAFALSAGTALAGEWSGQITISGGNHYTRTGQNWFEVVACPIATFNVSASIADDWGSAGGLGNANDPNEPCISNWTGTGPLSSSFTIYNDDPSNSRTFNVYAYY